MRQKFIDARATLAGLAWFGPQGPKQAPAGSRLAVGAVGIETRVETLQAAEEQVQARGQEDFVLCGRTREIRQRQQGFRGFCRGVVRRMGKDRMREDGEFFAPAVASATSRLATGKLESCA